MKADRSVVPNIPYRALLLGVLLFSPAGKLNYWQAWVFIVVFMASVSVIGLYLALTDPALLERRMKWSLSIIALASPALIWRILDVEKFLKKGLPGYEEYSQIRGYRLIPYIW